MISYVFILFGLVDVNSCDFASFLLSCAKSVFLILFVILLLYVCGFLTLWCIFRKIESLQRINETQGAQLEEMEQVINTLSNTKELFIARCDELARKNDRLKRKNRQLQMENSNQSEMFDEFCECMKKGAIYSRLLITAVGGTAMGDEKIKEIVNMGFDKLREEYIDIEKETLQRGNIKQLIDKFNGLETQRRIEKYQKMNQKYLKVREEQHKQQQQQQQKQQAREEEKRSQSKIRKEKKTQQKQPLIPDREPIVISSDDADEE